MRPRALIVEDDEQIIHRIEEILISLGHEHDYATNQLDAQLLLEKNDYSYVLLDLQIPAQPNRGGADSEFGGNLLRNIQNIKGRGVLPVIVMTAHSADCLDLSMELSANGASEFIAKPFPNKNRTLATVIRKVLGSRPAPPIGAESQAPFNGTEMVFYSDRVELHGVEISRGASSIQRRILNALKRRKQNGTFVALSGEELAKAIKIKGGEKSVAGAISGLRTKINRALQGRNIASNRLDVILNRGAGYHLAAEICVKELGDSEMRLTRDIATRSGVPVVRNRAVPNDPIRSVPNDPIPGVPNDPNDSGRNDPDDPIRPDGTEERLQWILDRLAEGVRLKGPDIVEQFSCSKKTADRLVRSLKENGTIEFVGTTRTGYYRLRPKCRPSATSR